MKKLFALAMLLSLLLPAVAMAAEPAAAEPAPTGSYFFPPGLPGIAIGVAVGLGLIIIGAGKGIGNIGAHATDAIARQPEAGGRIFTTMIISAALIEGVTLFAIVVALLIVFRG